MDNAIEFRIVYISIDSYDNACKISQILVKENLAACCSIIQNVTSFFKWENEIVNRNEFIIMVKTHFSKLDSLSKIVSENHTDEVPEIISVNLAESIEPYLIWLKKELI